MNDTGNTKVNPKAHYEPKSVQEWRELLQKDTHGGFLIFRELYRSGAFQELCRKPKHVRVWLEAYVQLNFEKTDKRTGRRAKKQGEKRDKKALVYKDDGIVYLTQNRLKAVGVGVTTQVEAKKALVTLGVLDAVATSASANNDGKFSPSVFRVSDRWRKYPNVPPQEDGIQISRQVYHEHSLANPNHPIHRNA